MFTYVDVVSVFVSVSASLSVPASVSVKHVR